MKQIDSVQTINLPMSSIETNKGQIPGVPKNPRFIRDESYRKLLKSLQDDEWMLGLKPLIVYKHGEKYIIIGGNMRYRAMSELGYAEAPCKVIPESVTAAQLRACVIKDNSSFGEWELEELLRDWNLQELQDWGLDIDEPTDLNGEVEAKDDNFEPVTPKQPKSKLGDMFKLGKHRLVCGDSCETATMEALMQETTADCWITDPPYNVDYESADGKKIQNDHMEANQFQDFLTKAFQTATAYLKQGGSFYIWHADSEGYNFRAAANRAGLTIRQCLMWKKNSLVLGRQDYQWIHEPCLYGWKDGAAHYFTSRRDLTTALDWRDTSPDLAKMRKEELVDMLTKILNLPNSIIEEDKPLRSAEHPTMKPLPLIGRLINNSTRKGDTIIDTFGGSGSTLMACEQLGRICATVELDPVYVDVIINRWEEFTGQKAEYYGNFMEDL